MCLVRSSGNPRPAGLASAFITLAVLLSGGVRARKSLAGESAGRGGRWGECAAAFRTATSLTPTISLVVRANRIASLRSVLRVSVCSSSGVL